MSEGRSPGYLTRHLSPERIAELSQIQRQWVSEDLAYFRPQVVAVWRCGFLPCTQPGSPTYFDLLAWLDVSPQFREVWANYQYQRTYGDHIEVYVRKPGAP